MDAMNLNVLWVAVPVLMLAWANGENDVCKGVATLLGAFGVAAPGPTAVAAGVLVLTAAASRMMSLASLLGCVSLPLALWWWRDPSYPRYAVVAAVLTGVVIFWRHRVNIGRIVRGEESKLGGAKK